MTECPMCDGHGSWSKRQQARDRPIWPAPIFDTCPRCNGTGDLDQYDHEKIMDKFFEENPHILDPPT